jgi:hypothetical protein
LASHGRTFGRQRGGVGWQRLFVVRDLGRAERRLDGEAVADSDQNEARVGVGAVLLGISDTQSSGLCDGWIAATTIVPRERSVAAAEAAEAGVHSGA